MRGFESHSYHFFTIDAQSIRVGIEEYSFFEIFASRSEYLFFIMIRFMWLAWIQQLFFIHSKIISIVVKALPQDELPQALVNQ